MTESTFTMVLIAIEVLFTLMLLRTLCKAGAKKTLLITMSVVFTAWLVTDYLLLSQGFFSKTGVPQLAFVLAIEIPIIAGLLAQRFSKSFAAVISNISVHDFLRLQIMRAAFGVMFFFTAALPAWFQFLGGLGDIAAGIGAFFGLLYLSKNPDKETWANIKGNLIGILDFIVVIHMGVFVVLNAQSPDMMFDLIPLYVVPTFILLHIFSLQKLANSSASSSKQQLSHD